MSDSTTPREFAVSDWEQYEQAIFNHLTSEYSRLGRLASVVRDVRIWGRMSGTSRQIDVLVTCAGNGGDVRIAYDAKFHSRPIDVKHVEEFIGLLRDVGVDRGVLVSSSGYTDAAYRRAMHDEADLDLDIWTQDEFLQWQAGAGLPYAGRNGVLLGAPLGWVLDGQRRTGWTACLYRRGLTFDMAAQEKEFMYVKFWSRESATDSIDELMRTQEDAVVSESPGVVVSRRELVSGVDRRLVVRRISGGHYPVPELTGFAEFDDFIFFAVLFTPLEVERRNVRKLEFVLRTLIPVKVRRP